MENILFGKTIVWDGDSICAGGAEKGNWATRIASRNSMNCKNYAVGGGTITEGAPKSASGNERHCVSTTLEKMYAEYPDADYIILEGGTNDADLLEALSGSSRLGTIAPDDFSGNYDRETFCGALESVFYRATKYWMGKKIGFIVAHKMGVIPNERRRRRMYFDMAVKACKKWGIPYVDLWEGCYLNPCLPWMCDKSKTPEENCAENVLFYSDGQHLTSRGYDFTSEIIENWMRTL